MVSSMTISDEKSSCDGIAVPEHTIYIRVDYNSDKSTLGDVEKFLKGNYGALMEEFNR